MKKNERGVDETVPSLYSDPRTFTQWQSQDFHYGESKKMQECHTTDSNLWPKAILKASLCIEGIPKYKYTGKECFYPSCTV